MSIADEILACEAELMHACTPLGNRFGDFAARSTNSLPYGRGSDWVAVCWQPLTEPPRPLSI